MATEKTIAAILLVLKQAAEDAPGFNSHYDADTALCDLICLLIKDHPQEHTIKEAIDVYEDMDKWYA